MRVMSWLMLLVAALLAASCSSVEPVTVNVGDTCYQCRNAILEPRLAGEMVDPNGLAYKFGKPGCLAKYVAEHPDDKATLFVTDFVTGHMIYAERASYVPVIVDTDTMERDYRAYLSLEEARAFAGTEKATVLDWKTVVEKARG